jgi:protein-disulfide isomerase
MALRIPVSTSDHVQGNESASIELVEYGDYQCPYCGMAYPIVKNIQQQLGNKLKFIFRNFPLAKIHPQAVLAATAAEAAALQGKFWEMHDMLFENQKRLNISSIISYATELGLDTDQFKNDMNDPSMAEKIDNEFYSGMRSGVNATPSFFINGEKYEGDWDHEKDFLQYLNDLIK